MPNVKGSELEAQLEKARRHVMTPGERYEQMVSFCWGMQKLSVFGLSHDEIKAMLAARGIVEPAA